MSDDKHIRKPNAIIQAGQDLSATQQNILYSMLRRFSFLAGSEDDDELAKVTYKIPIREAVPNFESIKGGRAYELVKNHASGMVKQFLTRKHGKTIEYFNLVSYAKVVEGGSDIHVRFNIDVIPFLSSMVKDGYTKLVFKEVYDLKSAYSKRVYELITLNRKSPLVKKQGYFEISVEEFRFKLGVDEKKYPRWSDFKRRVIDPSVSEIEEKTTLRFNLEFNKIGRKIVGLLFREIIEVSHGDDITNKSVEQITMNLGNPIDSETLNTSEGNPLLDGLNPGHRKEIEEKHTPQFIEYYYKKVVELNNKGRMKSTFANCLFGFISKDLDQFYEREKLKQAQRDEEERMIKIQRKAELLKEKRENEKKQLDKERVIELEKLFDALPHPEQELRINKLINENPFLKEVSDAFLREQVISQYGKELA